MLPNRYETNYILIDAEGLEIERQQVIDEGRDFERITDEYADLHGVLSSGNPMEHQDRVRDFLDQTIELPIIDEYPYVEPNNLAEIRSQRPKGPRSLNINLDEDTLYRHFLAAWRGRCAGCLLGAPVEGWYRDQMRGYLQGRDAYPLDDYFESDPETLAANDIKRRDPPRRCFVNEIDHMPENDDTTYTVANLAMLMRNGFDFEPTDVAFFWLRYLPMIQVATAERVAYRNFANLVMPPESARRYNPYREMIGATIRADTYGYVSIGNPERAAELAWRDARISHVKNGIYGEMWVAAMIAVAPLVEGPEEMIRIGLSEVPADSRLAEAVKTVLEWDDEGIDYETAVDRIHERWDERKRYDWVHTVSNAQIITMGLIWGAGDFGRSICRTVQACFDTDSNGATVGSLVSALNGEVPDRWTAPLDDRLDTGMSTYFRGEDTGIEGYHERHLPDLANETLIRYREHDCR